MTRDYEQTALELVGRWTIACPPEHPLWNHRRMAIGAALRTEHLAALREARDVAAAEGVKEPGVYNQGVNTAVDAIEALIAEAEKESETDDNK